MPLDIWADLLEDQGQDTSALRAWIEIGVKSQGSQFTSFDYHPELSYTYIIYETRKSTGDDWWRGEIGMGDGYWVSGDTSYPT